MNQFDRDKEKTPDVSKLLHAYRNIDKKIELEIEAIEAGKKIAAKILLALEQVPESKADRLYAAEAVQELRAMEMDHLLRYRHFVTVKYRCLQGFGGVDGDAAELLIARAVDGKGWAEIAGKFRYSESQARRRYQDALNLFITTLEMNDTCA